MGRIESWTAIGFIFLMEVAYGTVTYFVFLRRLRRGRGWSPVLSPLFIGYWMVILGSHESLLLGLNKWSVARIIESLAMGFVALVVSVATTIILPNWLAERTVGGPSDPPGSKS